MKRIFITIYILLLATLFSIPFGINPIIEALFEEGITKTNRDLSRGTFSLIVERLQGLDPDQQAAEMERLQPRFGYPISLSRLSEVNVDDKDRTELINGLIVEEEGVDRLLLRLGTSDRVVTMGGPFPGERLDFKATILFLGLFLIFLTVPALAWTFFLIRDIRKIETFTGCFAAGDHDARVRVSRISSMTAIAQAFNTMAEKTQKLIASQKDLANSVSHEIRTPLARIKFSLEMVKDRHGSDSRGIDHVAEIGRDVEEIESLVDEMLTYARFEREPETLGQLSSHDMVSWLEGLIHQEQKGSPDKKIDFSTLTGRLITRFEPVYLGWAVRNLIRNGVKYADGRVTLSFKPGQSQAYIHVDDDGQGIPEASREKIFEPFYRLDQSRSKASGGYGLGLAIVRRIITWHKGSIKVSESPLGGARFTLILPLDPGDEGMD